MYEGQFAELSPEEAQALGGMGLSVPEHGVTTTKVTFGAGTDSEREVEQHTWDEIAILDSIEPQTDTKEGRFEGMPQDERAPEVWVAKWHIAVGDDGPNGGRKVTDFMEFIWDLAKVDRATLEDYAKKYKKTKEPKRFWQSRFFDLSGNCRKMATILRAAGHGDRLLKGQFFAGFGSCFDVLPMVRGTKYVIKVQQQEDKNGIPRDTVKAVREYKG